VHQQGGRAKEREASRWRPRRGSARRLRVFSRHRMRGVDDSDDDGWRSGAKRAALLQDAGGRGNICLPAPPITSRSSAQLSRRRQTAGAAASAAFAALRAQWRGGSLPLRFTMTGSMAAVAMWLARIGCCGGLGKTLRHCVCGLCGPSSYRCRCCLLHSEGGRRKEEGRRRADNGRIWTGLTRTRRAATADAACLTA